MIGGGTVIKYSHSSTNCRNAGFTESEYISSLAKVTVVAEDTLGQKT